MREVTPIAAENAISGSNPSHRPNPSGRVLAFPGSPYSTTPPGGSCWVCGTSDSTRTLSFSGGMADVVLSVWPVLGVGHSHLWAVLQGEDVGVW